jgi:hypothetical protein
MKCRQHGTSDLKKGFAVLAGNAKGARERDTYLPASVSTDPSGVLIATPLKWQGRRILLGLHGPIR